MARLTIREIGDLARRVGVPPGQLVTCVAIAMAESGGDTAAVNTTNNVPPSRDRGLWQINSHWHPDVTDACAFDPDCNARAMFRISQHATTWQPWSAYNNGAYKQHLAAVRAAIEPRRLFLATPRLTGEDVRRLQARLNQRAPAYSHLAENGSFGPLTDGVVREFQRRSGLADDGVVGPLTRAALGL